MQIDHIVVLMMENNGFDRMLGWMGAAGRDVDGVDPARLLSNPDTMAGREVFQVETRTRNIRRDPLHYLPNCLMQYAGGTNRGFVDDYVRNYPTSTPEERQEIMAWYPRSFLPGLHALAEREKNQSPMDAARGDDRLLRSLHTRRTCAQMELAPSAAENRKRCKRAEHGYRRKRSDRLEKFYASF